MEEEEIAEIERILGYHFFEPQHLIRALTHPAYANEILQHNKKCLDQEAYSTLGDAVLKTALILFLMEKGFQTKGDITQAKEDLESNVNLAKIAARMKIRKYIRLGKGAKGLWNTGEETILADTVEALIGAIFLDSDTGFGVVKQCIGKWLDPELKKPEPAKKALALHKPAMKKPHRKAGGEKPALPKTPDRLVPRQISPLPSSSTRGAPRGTKPPLRRSSR